MANMISEKTSSKCQFDQDNRVLNNNNRNINKELNRDNTFLFKVMVAYTNQLKQPSLILEPVLEITDIKFQKNFV